LHAAGGFQSATFTKSCMSANEYHFITHWRVPGTVEEIPDVLGEPAGLPRWWPSVYLAVHEIEHGSESGVGRVVELHTKGWLPYTLHWFFRVTESRRPFGFSLQAWGDFEGIGVWTLRRTDALSTLLTIGEFGRRSRCCVIYRFC
jgi:hypothetical protein